MKRRYNVLYIMIVLITLLTGCGGKAETSKINTSVEEKNDVIRSSENIENEENQPLVIYHISDDEIELHFTSDKLSSIERLTFLVPMDDESGSYNPCINIDLIHEGNEMSPVVFVLNETMDIDYTIDFYGEGVEASVEENTLICHIQHENIIEPFKKAVLWHTTPNDSGEPQSFEGVITDDVSTIITPAVEGFLPAEFKRSEYDDQYFKPESDDFIVLTYEIPIRLPLPEWYQTAIDYHYGLFRSEKESSVIVTYLISYVDGKYTSTKLRLEFESIDDAMVSSLVYDYDIVPLALGHPNAVDDSLVTAEFFEDCDQRRYGGLTESNHDVVYNGHFDQFRYFEYKVRDTLPEIKTLMSVPLTEYSDMLAYISMSALSYLAGKTQTCEIPEYSGNVPATTYSSKRTHEAGSDDAVLDIINDLPGDSQYFVPATDDYAYVIESNIEQGDERYGSEYFKQDVYLYSFDDSGKIIQCIYRLQYFEWLEDNSETGGFAESFKSWNFDKASGAYYIDYLAEYEGGELYSSENETAKENLLFDLMKNGQHEGFYFSKP